MLILFSHFSQTYNLLAFVLIHDEFYKTSLLNGANYDELDKTSLYYGSDIYCYRSVTFFENVTGNPSQIK